MPFHDVVSTDRDRAKIGARLTPHRMKEVLGRAEPIFGIWIDAMRTPGIVRLAAAAGCDFIFIDMEHSSLSFETVGDLCEMARACGVTPVVRPYALNAGLIGRLLDIGAMGVMFHDVAEVEQVELMRSAAFYPPVGRRGSTAQCVAQDYQQAPGAELTAAINERVLIAAQIESAQGVERIDALLTPGVIDFIEIGRGDLSTDLGVPLETRHPAVLEAIDTVIAACRRHGVACGTLSPTVEDATDMLGRGMRSIVLPNERTILLNHYRTTLSALHAVEMS